MAIGTPTACIANIQDASASTTRTLTTNAIIPSGALAIVVMSWGASTAVTVTGSGGPGGWSTDKSQPFVGAINWGFAVLGAQVPSGLGSGLTLATITFSGVPLGANISAYYCTGLATSSPVDVTAGQGVTTGAGAWTTGTNTTTVADTLVIGGCVLDGPATSTPGQTELADFVNATHSWGHTTCYQTLSATATTSLTGTWSDSGTLDKTSAFVAYQIAGAAASEIPILVMAPPIPT